MKVPGHDRAEPGRPTSAPGPFHRVLQQTGAPPRPPQPPALPRVPVPPSRALAQGPALTPARSALASPENLGQARQAMHGEAHRLRGLRTEAQTVAQEKTEHRLSELISQELARQPPAESLPVSAPRAGPPLSEAMQRPTEGLPGAAETRLAASGASLAPPESPNPQLKIQAALELIEKIEVFVRSQRPALRMSLGWPLSAMVEVERTGPREVSLRIQGRHGPLAQEDLSRIRDALDARGLRLRSLHAQ